MALQKGTKNGWPIVEDSGAPGVPVTDLTGDGGDLIAEMLALVAERVPRRLHVNVTPVGNVGSGEDDLMSYTIPANTFANDGDSITFRMVYQINVNGQAVGVYFDGNLRTSVTMYNDITPQPIEMTVTRLTSTTAEVFCQTFDYINGIFIGAGVLTGLDFTSTIVAKSTCTGTSNDDVQQILNKVYYYPAA